MPTILDHVSNLRGLIKQYSRNQEEFTNQFLFNILSGARADVLKARLDRYNKVADENYLTLCIQLEQTKPHTCDCVPLGLECLVLRTKFKIPPVLSGRNTSKIRISTISGKQISIMTEPEWRLVVDRPVVNREYTATYINGYYYFWNLPLNLKVIQISGIFSNPLDLLDIPNCSNTTGVVVGTCFSLETTDFPLQEEFKHLVYRKCFELLQIPLQTPQDQTNDSNEFIKM